MNFTIRFSDGDFSTDVARTATYEAARDIVDGLVLLNAQEGELGGEYTILEDGVNVTVVQNAAVAA